MVRVTTEITIMSTLIDAQYALKQKDSQSKIPVSNQSEKGFKFGFHRYHLNNLIMVMQRREEENTVSML